jgi:DNA-binding transcriptional regulator YhcF (GntR family)
VAPLKRDAAARLVREKIADGTLKPGDPVPSGAALARETGSCALTCRAALRALLADGTLTRGVSAGARLRVAPSPGGGADADALRRALSAALAERRRAWGLTQHALAALLGASVTTVGHAETGRVWQSRDFWCRADAVLGGTGDLLRMYDQHRAAEVRPAAPEAPAPPAPPPPAPPVLPASVVITPEGVAVTWPDGTETLVMPPGCRDGGSGPSCP